MLIPKPSEHQVFVGTNGSGKTTLSAWVLSNRNIDQMPHVILNTKDDELLNEIPHAVEMDGLTLPKEKYMKRGVFMARPINNDWDGIENLMKEIWSRTGIGFLVDEALSISRPEHPYYRMLLSQGRSRQCPVDSNTQRPRFIDRYAFSESNHIYIMRLNDERDLEPITEITGSKRWIKQGGKTVEEAMEALPEFYAYRFHAPTKQITLVPPAPQKDAILENFERKLAPGRERVYVY